MWLPFLRYYVILAVKQLFGKATLFRSGTYMLFEFKRTGTVIKHIDQS